MKKVSIKKVLGIALVCLMIGAMFGWLPVLVREVEGSDPGLADSPWPMFRHDPQHTGRSPYIGPEVPELKWRYATGGSILSSPAIGSDGTIYVGSNDNYLYALNPDGSVKWRYAIGEPIDSYDSYLVMGAPAIGSDGTIYFGSADGKLYAVRGDGVLRWSFDTGGSGIESSPTIANDGTIYFAASGRQESSVFYALNQDGTLKWSYQTPGWSLSSSPAIGSNQIIYLTDYDRFYAFNKDGDMEWSYTVLPGQGYVPDVYSSPAIAPDGAIVFGVEAYISGNVPSHWGELYRINPDGTLAWSYKVDNPIYSSPAINLDGTIYFGSVSLDVGVEVNYIYAVDSDGTLKWSYQIDGEVLSSPAIDSNGVVYFSSASFSWGSGGGVKGIYAVNSDGTLKWFYQMDGDIWSSPAIGSDGTIYFGSNVGYLYAIGESALPTPTPTPTLTPTPTPIPPIYSIDRNLKVEVSVSADKLDDFIRSKGVVWVGGKGYDSTDSPLVGLGQAWVDAGDKYAINSIYLMAHAIHESGWGFSSIAQNKNNIYGYGAYDPDPYGGAYTFSSYEECIDKCAGWINTNYLTPGGKYYVEPTLRGMIVNYATDPSWGENIAALMNEFTDFTGWIEAEVHSPTEFRVYDSQGRVTGMLKGEERNEIPNSGYYDNTVTILSPSDSYTYEVVGTGEGSYDVTVTKVMEGASNTFTATDLPTSLDAVQKYSIDWDALSQGEEGVTVQIDSDGDGTFENTITADSDLTQEEYLIATGEEEEEGFASWIWPVVGLSSVLLVLLAVIIYLRVIRKKPNATEDITTGAMKCPICGSDTVIRTSKRGTNAGSQFHVCARYPACKGKIAIK